MVTNPPKWWFGDAIDLYSLPWWQTFLVSDYVWLALATLALYALACRCLPVRSAQKSPAEAGQETALR